MPITNTVSSKDFLYAVADFNLGAVTEKTIGSSAAPDIVFESADKLLVSFHLVDVTDEGLHAAIKLSAFGAGINGRSIRVYGVGCNGFITPMDVESRKRRFVSPLHVSAHWHRGMLCCILKRFLDDVRR